MEFNCQMDQIGSVVDFIFRKAEEVFNFTEAKLNF